jgi:UDPglucose 6-dehydrogenase
VLSNPELLREGSAFKDFMYPDRIVVGAETRRSERVMEELYDAFAKKQDRIQFVGIRDAEMIKYAANSMLATKISFMNEIALMCDQLGVDVENVRRGMGSDPRIGTSFIYPGCGYGGSCFPKDVRAMIHMAEEAGLDDNIFEAVERRNDKQQLVLVDKVVEHFQEDLTGKRFALWGLAFKPETDDIRGAPAIAIAKALTERGAEIAAFDPQAMEAASSALEGCRVTYTDNPYDATEGADALIVVTEWRQFRQPDFRLLANQLTSRTIFDGRNIYNPQRCADYGLTYFGIGRNSALFG